MLKPPAQLDNADALFWAWSNTPFFNMKDTNGKEVVDIHGLAIIKYPTSPSFYRLSCDKNWESENDWDFNSLEEALTSKSGSYDISKVIWIKFEN